jgi:SAM-dependent methyltransferase
MISPGHRFRLALWRARNRGTQRRCPACGTTVSRFAPYGVALRPDAQCPGCGSLERHRALWLYLQRQTAFFDRSLRVLLIAPDPMLDAEGRRRHPDFLSIDLAPGFAMRRMDLTALELPDEDRDLVIAYHVLEHIPDDQAAMREIRRVLKPGGIALLEVPVSEGATDERYASAPPEVRAEHYGQPDHVRQYGRSDFEARLLAHGLEPEAIRVGDVMPADVESAALDPDEIFYRVVRAGER